MSNPPIQVFKPFGVHPKGSFWQSTVQEVLYYADSRFRAATAEIIKGDIRQRCWKQQALREEMVCGHTHIYIYIFNDLNFSEQVHCYVFHWPRDITQQDGGNSHPFAFSGTIIPLRRTKRTRNAI